MENITFNSQLVKGDMKKLQKIIEIVNLEKLIERIKSWNFYNRR